MRLDEDQRKVLCNLSKTAVHLLEGRRAERMEAKYRQEAPGFRKDVTPLIHPSGGLRT